MRRDGRRASRGFAIDRRTLIFAGCRFDVAQGRLWRGTRELPLRPKTLAVLRYLLAHAGELVGKDALVEAVWSGVHVSKGVLPVCINELRHALDDDPHAPSCIRTVHGRGYHFAAQVTTAEPTTLRTRARRPRSDLSERARQLWERLGAYPAPRTEAGLIHLLESLCAMFEAQQASWTGAVRLHDDPADPLCGWRPCVHRPLRMTDGVRFAFERGRAHIDQGGAPDLSTRRHAQMAGVFRAHRLCDFLPRTWFESDFYRLTYLAHDMLDAVYVAVPVTSDCESYVMLARSVGRPRFSVAERDEIAYCLRGMQGFHRRLLLSHGLLVAREPLSDDERMLLGQLLTDASEAAIAQACGASIAATRALAAALYARFGVRDRVALMALWLGQPGA